MCDLALDSLVEASDDEPATRPYLANFDEDTASMPRSDLEVLLEQGRPSHPDLSCASANATPLPTITAVPSVAPMMMAPSASTVRPPAAAAPEGPSWVRVFAYGALGCVMGGVLAVAVMTRAGAPRAAEATAASGAPAATAPVTEVAPEADDEAARAEREVAREAREALVVLAEGIAACARASGALPGSSPAVPESAEQLAGEGFAAKGAEWSTPVWRCARFRGPEVMRYQLQWQLVKPSSEGRAVAWIDADGDGKAERALAVRVARAADRVTIADVEVLDPMPAVPSR